MIERTVLEYLRGKLSVPVSMERLQTGGSYCLVELVSGGEADHIRRAMIAVQSYAKRLEDAAVLNEEVIQSMKELAYLPDVSHCSLNSTYNFTDPERKEYRYQAVFNLVYFND